MATTPNERIRKAREDARLDPGEVAHQLGLSWEEYNDLEMFEDEAETVISLRTLQSLARALGLTPLMILEGPGCAPASRTLTVSEFSSSVAASIRASGVDVEAWGERAGWDVAPLLEDPEQVWELNVDGLRDVAGAAGLDWRAVLVTDD